ncbi:hypothetical protein QJQ45_006823 [Haematococcus lacustris]|nr:hypothetical protein QJQ45_006823 [Haematococcus lacustris]
MCITRHCDSVSAGARGSGQQVQGQGQAAKVVIAERRQVIKAGLRGLVKAALPDLSPAQIDAIVAEINKRMTIGSKQCCPTAVLCLSLLLQSFLGQPSPAQPTRDFLAAGPAPGPSPPPDPACPPYAHPRLATRSSPRTAAAPAQLPPPVQLDIWDPQLLVQLKNAMELLTNASVIEHMMRGPHHRGIRLLPGDGNSLNANATNIITSIKEFYRHPGRFINRWGKVVGVVEGGFSRGMKLQFPQLVLASYIQNSGWEFARRVETDGVSISVHFVRSQAVNEPVELPSRWGGIRQWEWELTKGQLKHDSGLTKAKQDTARWSAAIQPQLQRLAAATPADTTLDSLHAHILSLNATWGALWEEYLKPRWRRQRLALHHAQERDYHEERGVAVFLGAGNFCQGGWKAGAVQAGFRKVVEQPGRPNTDPRPDRLVIVDEFRTTRVSSSVHARQPCELHLPPDQPRPADWVPPAGQVNHWLLRPAWSLRHAKEVRGLKWTNRLPSPHLGQCHDPRGRWLDRDTNPCLNFQRIGESKQRPLELCRWDDLEALPPIGKEYKQGYKRVNDRLPKVKQRLQRAAEVRRGIDDRARNNASTLNNIDVQDFTLQLPKLRAAVRLEEVAAASARAPARAAHKATTAACSVLYLAAILDPRYKMLHFQFSPAQFSQAEQVLSRLVTVDGSQVDQPVAMALEQLRRGWGSSAAGFVHPCLVASAAFVHPCLVAAAAFIYFNKRVLERRPKPQPEAEWQQFAQWMQHMPAEA